MQCKPLRRLLRESRIRWAAVEGAGFPVIAAIITRGWLTWPQSEDSSGPASSSTRSRV
jgi:hypothetical protein